MINIDDNMLARMREKVAVQPCCPIGFKRVELSCVECSAAKEHPDSYILGNIKPVWTKCII